MNDVKGRTGCGRCYECIHHALDGKQYKCLNQHSTASKMCKNNDGVEILLPDRFVYDFHDCCEVE